MNEDLEGGGVDGLGQVTAAAQIGVGEGHAGGAELLGAARGGAGAGAGGAGDDRDGVAARGEVQGEVRSEVARAAGDQDVHGAPGAEHPAGGEATSTETSAGTRVGGRETGSL